ncbi:MAG: hypothetical protein RQ899_10815 [Pseudomonadales bacterium]|nr:hypothetical protein [Pseudomonadales bacterium]
MKLPLPLLESFAPRDLGARLLDLYRAGTRADLIRRTDYSLVVFEDTLIDTESGASREIVASEGLSRPEAIAAAAGAMLAEKDREVPVLLLLPATAFVATAYAMTNLSEKMIRSALKLQAHSLLPGFVGDLLLGLDASAPEGMALWLPAATADSFFNAFRQQGLFLAGIMPRTLAVIDPQAQVPDLVVSDNDSSHCTLMHCHRGVIRSLHSISRRDLAQEEFSRQWQELSEASQLPESRTLTQVSDWTGLRQKVSGHLPYSFLPAGSEQAGRRLEQQKNRRILGAAALAVLLLLCVPFMANWLKIRQLEALSANFVENSAEARSRQEAVFAMENEWGELLSYPDQDVAALLLSLNAVIESSLISFAINKGVVDIQGYAQDPAFLVEQLAAREEFYDVTQSGRVSGGNSSARGDSFGIRMNLANIDFKSYDAKYPARNEASQAGLR